MSELSIRYRPVTELAAYAKNARTHSPEQVAQIAASIEEFGWTNPILVDEEGGLLAGHGRVAAALLRGDEQVPTVTVAGLSQEQKRALVIADNKIAMNAGWDDGLLRAELLTLKDADFDLDVLGFAANELAEFFGHEENGNTDPDEVPSAPTAALSKAGDVWILGRHRLICGDATDPETVDQVLEGGRADLCLTDPPYGLGGGKASGKNDYAEYEDSRENLIALAAGWLPIARERCDAVVFSPGVTNLWLYPEANWVMCWFYGGGQLRSSWGFNCWQPFLAYGKDPSLASGHGGRPDAVDMNTPANAGDIDHPCPKPVALWEWFFERLVFKNDAIVFDPFSGSGTTIIAAEKAGYAVRAVELTPRYVDVAVLRWQAFTGQQAIHAETGLPFGTEEAIAA